MVGFNLQQPKMGPKKEKKRKNKGNPNTAFSGYGPSSDIIPIPIPIPIPMWVLTPKREKSKPRDVHIGVPRNIGLASLSNFAGAIFEIYQD